MINSQAHLSPTAVLARIIVSPEYFPASQLDVWARTVNLELKPYDRWFRYFQADRANVATAVCNHRGFSPQY
jgi:hypothetical protein